MDPHGLSLMARHGEREGLRLATLLSNLPLFCRMPVNEHQPYHYISVATYVTMYVHTLQGCMYMYKYTGV